jgi:hypothetical protein
VPCSIYLCRQLSLKCHEQQISAAFEIPGQMQQSFLQVGGLQLRKPVESQISLRTVTTVPPSFGEQWCAALRSRN